jgi:hypothetical protein
VAAYLDQHAQQVLTDLILATADVSPVVDAPPGVEARSRVRTGGAETLILVNHGRTVRRVDLPWEAYDHLSDAQVGRAVELPAMGSAVLTRAPVTTPVAVPEGAP